MAKTSSSKKLKDNTTQKVPSKKLDFLLDTIDTEVANLADVVDVEGPILDAQKSRENEGSVSLSDGGVGLDSLELDMDFLKEPEEPATEKEPSDKGAQAALDAMSDAEGEVEAMLSKEEASGKPTAAPANVADKEKVNPDLAKALDELLATREVDASKFLEKSDKQKAEQSKKTEPERLQTGEDKLPEDLFDDLDKDLELVLEGAATENPAATDDSVDEEDLLGDLEMDFAAETTSEQTTKEAAIEAGISKDLFETTEQNIATAEKDENDAGSVTSAPSSDSSSDQELANLLSKKIEALVNRLVEERLAEIAERVIWEKINKIFKSMK